MSWRTARARPASAAARLCLPRLALGVRAVMAMPLLAGGPATHAPLRSARDSSIRRVASIAQRGGSSMAPHGGLASRGPPGAGARKIAPRPRGGLCLGHAEAGPHGLVGGQGVRFGSCVAQARTVVPRHVGEAPVPDFRPASRNGVDAAVSSLRTRSSGRPPARDRDRAARSRARGSRRSPLRSRRRGTRSPAPRRRRRRCRPGTRPSDCTPR
jgi:hypothetical protein